MSAKRHRIAHDAVTRIEGVAETNCFLLSQIGKPINQPQLAEIQFRARPVC